MQITHRIFFGREKIMKKKITAILAMCMLAVTMAACGDGDVADDYSEPNNAAAADVEEADGADEAEASDEGETADAGTSGEFTLLDVTSDMISVGVYAADENQNELVFSMFTAPSGTPMASLFVYSPDGSGDVICGTYTAETNTDEDGMNWTLLTVTDVYTSQDFEIGFAENDSDQVYILNAAGAVYEGKYLSADETVTYMGTAVALLS